MTSLKKINRQIKDFKTLQLVILIHPQKPKTLILFKGYVNSLSVVVVKKAEGIPYNL